MSKPFHLPDEEPQTPSNMPSQSKSGYQALQNLWTQPPQPLPGPDNHPFFEMFAPNAYGSLLHPDIVTTTVKTHTVPDTVITAERQAFKRPLVYPFVPAPSICMEPMTPEKVFATILNEIAAVSTSRSSTPSLSFSDDHESSPESRPSPAKRPKGSRYMEDGVTTLKDEEEEELTPSVPAMMANQKPAQDNPAEMEVEAVCILAYMRAIPNTETSEPAVTAHGQIWRSPDKKKGWRRNQWTVDVR